ncbi:sigma-70 family RNA polymerase sigma factor [Aureibaculum marinum]|uniref:Sigma-70 family RNA polymerase sigma factor n=1 Tax=Aureibaculum marinum TaxID=2487930 RepID=A0A3N4NWP0_9FLAO|nr:sigma-70 family RNA polymerase sigma factor [Aureibaculum marinum]RPD99147.1 sigma-70 family RNA polymerase sigma factor [Aureibaculum marinum]
MNNILIDLKTENNFAFGKLYQDNFTKISKFVQNNNGNQADAEDLFQDAMMVLVEKLRQDNFKLTASIDTYVYAICKNLWFKKLRNKNYEISVDEMQSFDFLNSINDSIEDEKNYLEKLKGYLVKITDHCNRLIHDIFFREKAIEQIQKDYGYSSRHNAQNQKHKCVEQIRKVKEKEEKLKKS